MRAILAISKNSVGEALHRMMFQVLLLFALLFIVGGTFFAYMAPQEEDKMLKDLGLSIITIFGMIIAIFMGVSAVQPEVERRTIYALLAKPVRRYEFLVGKYVGSVVVLGLSVLLMGLVLVATLYVRQTVLNWPLMLAVAMIFIQLTVMLALVFMVSTFASQLMTVIVGMVIWVIGYLQVYLKDLAAHAQSTFTKYGLVLMNALLPDFQAFDLRSPVVDNLAIPPELVFNILRYGVLYGLVALALAIILFNEKQV
jgi:ABC-type transport system involved in multi-copper enzyme maturation permease subunit